MIKAVLFDLDDTLIKTETASFFSSYLNALGVYVFSTQSANTFSKNVVAAFNEAIEAYDSTRPLYPRFLERVAARLHYCKDPMELHQLFESYHATEYSALQSMIGCRSETPPFLKWLFERDYRVVVATNPATAESATLMRMAWGGIPADDYPFAEITTPESMHFGKPQPEYFEEILLRLGVSAGEAIMIGDDWGNDIVGAASCGMNTFWIADSGAVPPDDTPISAHGTYQRLIAMVKEGWLDDLTSPCWTSRTLIHRLRAFPAQLDTLRKQYSDDILEVPSVEGKASVRDIVRELGEHEAAENRERLRRIVEGGVPFLATNSNRWGTTGGRLQISMEQAFAEFVRQRKITIEWLLKLPKQVWRSPVYGETSDSLNLTQVVRLATEHDHKQLHKIKAALAHGRQT